MSNNKFNLQPIKLNPKILIRDTILCWGLFVAAYIMFNQGLFLKLVCIISPLFHSITSMYLAIKKSKDETTDKYAMWYSFELSWELTIAFTLWTIYFVKLCLPSLIAGVYCFLSLITTAVLSFSLIQHTFRNKNGVSQKNKLFFLIGLISVEFGVFVVLTKLLGIREHTFVNYLIVFLMLILYSAMLFCAIAYTVKIHLKEDK